MPELENQGNMKVSGTKFLETMVQDHKMKMGCSSSNLAPNTTYEFATHSLNVKFEVPSNILDPRNGTNWITFYAGTVTVTIIWFASLIVLLSVGQTIKWSF